MNEFSDMIDKCTLKYNNKFNHFCAPVATHFGVNHFWYHAVTHDGHYICLGSHLEWMEYYFSEKLYLPNPYLRTPENFNSGISFIRNTTDYSYETSVEIGVKNFKINQSILFLEKTEVGIEGYGFATHLPTSIFESLCISEMPLLKLFIKRFKEAFKPIINKMKDHYVNIAPLIGRAFYHKEGSLLLPTIDKSSFLQQLENKVIPPLSPREREVLIHLAEGMTAALIAEKLRLSRRTVEHYLENTKNKLNCYTKTELIQKSQDFLFSGYFLP